jgi:hypothetical protein
MERREGEERGERVTWREERRARRVGDRTPISLFPSLSLSTLSLLESLSVSMAVIVYAFPLYVYMSL